MDSVLEEKNWLLLSRILTLIEERLRQIFRETWKLITGVDWIEKDQDQVQTLLEKLGKKYKELGRVEKDFVNSGEVSKWDLSSLSKILRSEELLPLLDENFSANIKVAVKIRNFCSHHPNKNIPDEEFNEKWVEIRSIAGDLGVSELFINLISREIESEANSLENKYFQLKSDGNLHFKNSQYGQAIKLYTKALLLPELNDNQKGILYLNRCYAYMKDHMAKKSTNTDLINLALSDAEKCIKYCENRAKANFRLGQVHVLLKNYDKALFLYEKALEFEPNNTKIKEIYDSCKLERLDFLANSELDPYFNQSNKRIAERYCEIIGGDLAKETEKVSSRTISSIEGDDPFSDIQRALAYQEGAIVPQNFELAAKFFKKAADAAEIDKDENFAIEVWAKFQLALLYLKGQGVEKDFSKGFEMLKKIAKEDKQMLHELAVGIKESQYSIGIAYLHGIAVQKSIGNIFTMIATMYNQIKGDKVSLHYVSLLMDNQYNGKAIEWFKRSAENDFAHAAFILGAMYLDGEFFEGNEEIAVQYFELAASNSTPHSGAMEQIAHYYRRKQDTKMAKLWWDRGVQHGNMDETTTMPQKEFEEQLEFFDILAQCTGVISSIQIDPCAYELALKHPIRKIQIKAHRQSLKRVQETKIENRIDGTNRKIVSYSFKPSKTQTYPKSLQNLNFITLKEMDSTRDRIYEDFKIQLRIIDDPYINLDTRVIHLIVQDEDLKSQIVNILNYKILENYKNIYKYFGFGCEVVIMSPYMKMSMHGKGYIRVDEPATVISLEENNQDFCRFCIKPNAKKCCKICKFNYCSQSCQIEDLEHGHKLICKEPNETKLVMPPPALNLFYKT